MLLFNNDHGGKAVKNKCASQYSFENVVGRLLSLIDLSFLFVKRKKLIICFNFVPPFFFDVHLIFFFVYTL